MNRIVDRGARVAGWVGVAMALTIAISFMLVIPIGDVALSLLAAPAGLVIGYYANQRADRRGGPWPRVLANAAYAGLLTALGFVLFAGLVKGLFFVGDGGYRDDSAGGQINCSAGADCVYRRYVAAGQGDELARAGVTDAASFTGFYWRQQAVTLASIAVVTVGGALAGGLAYRVTNRVRPEPTPSPGVTA